MNIPESSGEKAKCQMCKFVRIFALIAFCLVLALILIMRIPLVASFNF